MPGRTMLSSSATNAPKHNDILLCYKCQKNQCHRETRIKSRPPAPMHTVRSTRFKTTIPNPRKRTTPILRQLRALRPARDHHRQLRHTSHIQRAVEIHMHQLRIIRLLEERTVVRPIKEQRHVGPMGVPDLCQYLLRTFSPAAIVLEPVMAA